jgi:uncharacterized membrane protein
MSVATLEVWNLFNSHLVVIGTIMLIAGIATALPIRFGQHVPEAVLVGRSRRAVGIAFAVIGLLLVVHGFGLFTVV